MSVIRSTKILLLGALLLSGGCASTPGGSPGSHGSQGGAGGTAQDAPANSASVPASDRQGEGATGASGGAAGQASAAGNGPGQTSDERRAAIDQHLNDSLGSFDAQLRTEQQRTAQERDTRRAEQAAGTAAPEGQGTDKNGDASGTAATETPDTDRPGGAGRRPSAGKPRDHSGDLKSEKASKKPDDNAGNGASVQAIPDGSDDDVVARRLRQAAERETDPELKAKLWQEYIDYKRNAQGR